MQILMNGKRNRIMVASEDTKTLQEAQTLYPNIVDMSEEFSNPAPTESEVLAKLREMLKNENGYATATPDKKLRIKGNRKKLNIFIQEIIIGMIITQQESLIGNLLFLVKK